MDFLSSLFSLFGSTALFTGSSRGLGFVLARGLSPAGIRRSWSGSWCTSVPRRPPS